MVATQDDARYIHFARIKPTDFRYIFKITPDYIGHHFMDDKDYSFLDIQTIDNREIKVNKNILSKPKNWVITTIKQYLIFGEHVRPNFFWFENLIKTFEKDENRFVIKYFINSNGDIEFLFKNIDGDLGIAIKTFANIVNCYENNGIRFKIDALYFLQLSAVIET